MPGAIDLRRERDGCLGIERRADVPLEAVLEALRLPGDLLKESGKARTRRVGAWVVKESRGRLKHALYPARYRAGWRAAVRLAERGVGAPWPVALVETRWAGLAVAHTTVLEYLDGWVNVEEFARRLVAEGMGPEGVAGYLAGLADAVNGLAEAGACHTDLSGKNIFTRTGQEFSFIDLDGVILDRPYSERLRLLNHVQLYDSFCDLWEDALLGRFLERMLPPGRNPEAWLEQVCAGQAARRARTEAIWRREGRLT